MAKDLEKEFDQEVDLDNAFDAEESLDAEFEAEAADIPESKSFGEKLNDQANKLKPAVITGGAIKGLQMAGEKVIGDKGAEDVIGLFGKMTPDQVKMITSDPKAYSKARDMADILDQFTELSKHVEETGYESAKQAKDIIRQKDLGLPTEDVQKVLGESLQKESYMPPQMEIPKDPEIFGAQATKEIISDMPESLEKVSGPAILSGPMKSKAKEQARILEAVGPEVKGQNLVNLLEDYGDMANYNKDAPSNVQAVFRNTRDEVRKATGKLDSEVDTLFKQSHQAIKDQDTLKRLLKLKELVKGDLEAGETTSRELGRIFGENAEDFAKNKVHIEDILNRYKKSGLLDEAGSAALKDYIEKSTKLTTKGLMSAGAASMLNKMVGMALFARETVGTKAQEMMARVVGMAKAPAETMAGKVIKGTLKGTAKGAYKALPLAGGIIAYNTARAEGKTPEQAAVIAAIDEATDVVLPLKLALMPTTAGEGSDVVPTEKGSPIKAKEPQTLEEMYDQLEMQVPKPESEIKVPMRDERRDIDKALKSPEKLETMLQQFNKLRDTNGMADMYARGLEDLKASKNDEEKAAIRFRLEQQPAFRKLLKKAEDMK